jgi:hypothetical protein
MCLEVVMAQFHVMARCGQVEHPLCKLGVAQRVFSVVIGSALGAVSSLCVHATIRPSSSSSSLIS